MNAADVLERVPIHTDADGVVRVARTRITLETIVDAFETGATAGEIAQQYPSVSLADVYSVITYYLRHKPEVDAYLKEREAVAERVREEVERRFPSTGIRERLLARRNEALRLMLRLAADENFNAGIVRGLLRRLPDLDIVRVQDSGLSGADDAAVLEWAAREGPIVLTHDISTLIGDAVDHVEAGEPMPGVFAARSRGPVGSMIKDLLLLAECSVDGEWEGQVRFLPL